MNANLRHGISMRGWRGQIIKWKWVTLKVKSSGEATPFSPSLRSGVTMRDTEAILPWTAWRVADSGSQITHPSSIRCNHRLSLFLRLYLSLSLVLSRSISAYACVCMYYVCMYVWAQHGSRHPLETQPDSLRRCVAVASAFALFSFGPRERKREGSLMLTSVII